MGTDFFFEPSTPLAPLVARSVFPTCWAFPKDESKRLKARPCAATEARPPFPSSCLSGAQCKGEEAFSFCYRGCPTGGGVHPPAAFFPKNRDSGPFPSPLVHQPSGHLNQGNNHSHAFSTTLSLTVKVNTGVPFRKVVNLSPGRSWPKNSSSDPVFLLAEFHDRSPPASSHPHDGDLFPDT